MDNDVKEMLNHLRIAILQDKNNYSRVLIDPMYKNVKPYVSDLIHDILRETQLKTETELSSLETNFKEYTNLLHTLKLPESTDKIIEKTKSDVIEIKRKMKNNSYFDYLENLEMISVINKRLIEVREELIEFKNSSKNNLEYLDTDLHNANLRLYKTSKKLNKLKSLKLINNIIVVLSLFLLLVAVTTDNRSYLLFLILGLGMVSCKKEVSEKDFTILSRLFKYIFVGIIYSTIIFISLAIVSLFSRVFADAIINIVFIAFAILLTATFVPDPNISKQESLVNDEKRNINNMESTVTKKRLIVSTLKSF
ncbi:MAG: hypothetical protein PHF18_04595 [Methanosarcina sp.]|uniref:hypothetical protein n=1 Tax=Methanosarcina sp. TaxID=2213 RepID=UPI002630CCA8|nr:hypothetical protein [Methanosarcina sp.]MDD3246125.1 hypothetical protein [Methanosarcina sp.]MDD4249890.1 hypothetical protein [Methanosarcina sp.]